MQKPQTWVEVIDPQTGLKLDVTVGFHHSCANMPSEANGCGEHEERTARVASLLVNLLGAQGFQLSDIETYARLFDDVTGEELDRG